MVAASTSQTTQMLYKACFVTIVFVFFLVKIRQDTFFKLEHSEQDPETPLGHFFGRNSTESDV